MARAATAAVTVLAGEREPVRVATTGNVSLSALQTIDGVALAPGDRVLVKNQSNPIENGIYTASAGQWFRAPDSRSVRTMQKGTTVHVKEGSTQVGHVYVFSSNPTNIGTDNITISFYLSDVIVGQIGENIEAIETIAEHIDALVELNENTDDLLLAADRAEAAAALAGSVIPPAYPANLTILKAIDSLAYSAAYLQDPLRYGMFVHSSVKGVRGNATVNSAGSGLPAATDYRVKMTGGGGTGATARVIVRSGAVVGAIVLEPGQGYTSAPSLSTNPTDWYLFHSNGTYAFLTESVTSANVDHTNDQFTVATNASLWTTGIKIRLSTSGTLPAPLQLNTDYYVIRISSTVIKLAASAVDASGGTAINLTDNGTGTHGLHGINVVVWPDISFALSDDILAVRADDGAEWLRQWDGVLDARWAGVTMDQVTDDLPAIQEAVKALLRGKTQIDESYGGSPQAGGTLFFPPGTAFCNSGVLFINSIGVSQGTEFVGIRMLGAVKASSRPTRPDGAHSGSKLAKVRIVCGDPQSTGVFEEVSRGFAVQHLEIIGGMQWYGVQHSPLVSDVRIVPDAPMGVLRDGRRVEGYGFYAKNCSTATFENFFITSGDQEYFASLANGADNELDGALLENCDQFYFQSSAFSFCRDGLKVLAPEPGVRGTNLVLDNVTFEANLREYLVVEGLRSLRGNITVLSRGVRDSTKPMVRIGGSVEQAINITFLGGSINGTPYLQDHLVKEVVNATTVKFWGNFTHRYPNGTTCKVSNNANQDVFTSVQSATVSSSTWDFTNYETTVVMTGSVFNTNFVDPFGNPLTRVLRDNLDAGIGIDLERVDGCNILGVSMTNLQTGINRQANALRVWHFGNTFSGIGGATVVRSASSTNAATSQHSVIGLDQIIQGTRSNSTLAAMLLLDSANDEVRLGNGSDVDTKLTGKDVVYTDKPLRVRAVNLAALGSAATAGAGAVQFCLNEAGGAQLVVSDGTNWRRMVDRAVAS